MTSSSSFGSNSLYYVALLGLAFATPPPNGLSLHNKINSPTHYTKGTLSPPKEALTACRHSISVSISLPLSGFFSPFPHGTCSLSVIEEYLGLDELVHPCSDRISRVPPYSRILLFNRYGAVTHYGRPFQVVRVHFTISLAWSGFARHYYRSLG